MDEECKPLPRSTSSRDAPRRATAVGRAPRGTCAAATSAEAAASASMSAREEAAGARMVAGGDVKGRGLGSVSAREGVCISGASQSCYLCT